ncbi:MAG: TPM domain-containing protein [Caulobacterales bacterium]|nr:TPM domain-containing protein [Caulobacterales bacterium]
MNSTRQFSVARPVAHLSLLLVLALVWAALAVAPAWGQTFPALSGRVVDQARLLDSETEAALTQKLTTLETDTGDQLVVVTLDSLQGYEIEDYGYRLGRHWGIGQKEGDNGVLLIIAPNERKVRIEVGYGLEPILTDALSTQIIQNDILPAFRTSAFQKGITDGVDAIDAQLRLDPAEAQARAETTRTTRPEAPIGTMVVVFLVFLFLFLALLGSPSRGRRHRGGVSPILIWSDSDAFRSGSRGRDSGWGGGGGGGGFSGGGGGFGGGGASGGW